MLKVEIFLDKWIISKFSMEIDSAIRGQYLIAHLKPKWNCICRAEHSRSQF